MTYVMAIDQGTTSSRTILFDGDLKVAAVAQKEFQQHFPAGGWVEHDPEDLWQSVVETAREAMDSADATASDIAAIGITNQRETTLVWDKATGKAVHNAIVWQDRRTADYCAEMVKAGHEETVTAKTGLLFDPYFSSTKLKWILDQADGARDRTAAGDLLFGTVDTWLIWRLTGGAAHVTDATNAARTMLFDIHEGRWSSTMCELLDIPIGILPEVRDCAADFGTTTPDVLGGAIPILGVAGDQQAATVGQACFESGMMKSTYGTGCFALLNTGDTPVRSESRLLTTIGYQLDGKPTYALEGAIFIAGAVVQWLRDGLKLISEASETQAMAQVSDPEQALTLVPAFTGLGAPYWKPDCRGAVFGLVRNSGPNELARAALESVGFQTRDLLEAMQADSPALSGGVLRVDGGMAASDWTMQFLADVTGVPVDRPDVLETTALGAAWLAGMKAGVYPDAATFASSRAFERRFEPDMDAGTRDAKYARWKSAVKATMSV